MLCASVLQALEEALEEANPAERRVSAPADDLASLDSSTTNISFTTDDEPATTSSSTASTVSADTTSSVGAPRDFSGHATGTTKAYNSVTKWVDASLRKLGKTADDLVLPSFEPNNALCSQVHATIAEWHTSRTTARDAGVIDPRPSELEKPPPQDCLVKTRGWLLRYINQARAEKNIPMVPDDKWGRKLAGVKADASTGVAGVAAAAAAAVPRMAGVKMEGELAGLASPPYKGNTVPGRLSSLFRRGGGGELVDGSAPAKLGKEPVAKDDVLEVMRQLEQQNSRDYAPPEQFLAAAAAKDGSKRGGAAGDSPSLYLMR